MFIFILVSLHVKIYCYAVQHKMCLEGNGSQTIYFNSKQQTPYLPLQSYLPWI